MLSILLAMNRPRVLLSVSALLLLGFWYLATVTEASNQKSATLSSASEKSFSPQAQYLSDGSAVAVWESAGRVSTIQIATKGALEKRFSNPITISDKGENAFNPQLTVSDNDKILIVWEQYQDSLSTVDFRIFEAERLKKLLQ